MSATGPPHLSLECRGASPHGGAGGKLDGKVDEARLAVTGTPDNGDLSHFSLYKGDDISDELLEECRKLFNNHYGNWSHSSDKAGKRIQLSSSSMRGYVPRDAGLAALARLGDELIGYALAIRFSSAMGVVSWVTQLVVHTQHHNRRIATKLLNSIWAMSDDYAWGIVSANPYAIRALEKATRRRCDPASAGTGFKTVAKVVSPWIHYIDGRPLCVSATRSVVNSRFLVDHRDIPEMVDNVSRAEQWRLGLLSEGEEWFAVTLQSQAQMRWTNAEWDSFLARGKDIALDAYERMSAGSSEAAGHPWERHTVHEVDWVIDCLELQPGCRVLDVGCGRGRHALELARRGYHVTALDFSEHAIATARAAAEAESLRVEFLHCDVRRADLGARFDAVVCLYDVVGSFPSDDDNEAIVSSISRHLVVGGHAAISVMNLELAECLATTKADVAADPSVLLDLRPSTTMQNSGNVWDPQYLLLDPKTGLIYRRERFGLDNELPLEVIVRDRRYRCSEVSELCARHRMGIKLIRPVAIGQWNVAIASTDRRAKEIVCAVEKF